MNLGAARHARPGTSTTGTQLPRIALNSVSTPGENHSFGGLLTLDSFLCLAQRVLTCPGGAWRRTRVRLPGLLARAREHRSGSPRSGHDSCSTSSPLLSARLRGLGPSYSDIPSSSRRTLNSRPVPATEKDGAGNGDGAERANRRASKAFQDGCPLSFFHRRLLGFDLETYVVQARLCYSINFNPSSRGDSAWSLFCPHWVPSRADRARTLKAKRTAGLRSPTGLWRMVLDVPPATRRSTLARSFLLPRHYLRGPGGRLSQLGSEGGPMVLRRKDAGRADRSGSAGGPAAFERTGGMAAGFPVPAPASFTPRPAERPGLHFSDPLEGRCGQKGCIFPARPGGSRLCAVHELEQREPKCFHSRQPSSLLLEQAKFGIVNPELASGRVRDRRLLTELLEAYWEAGQ